MVFFICDHCGESLKKNQVEKHTFRCRSQSYSCIDCQASFTPHTYQKHVKCLSEKQKYGSKNYVEKEAKGEVKQNAWCEQVQRAIEYVTEPRLKSLLQNIQGYNNIPRKEAKFINFLTNSCRIRDVQLCKMAWSAISDEASKLEKEEDGKKVNGKVENGCPSSDSVQKNGTAEIYTNEDASPCAAFKWKSTIKRKLREAGGEMKMKKLRSAVIDAYREAVGDEQEIQDIQELFEAKLAKSKVIINGKLISLPS
ncbi:hypothetical protein KIN20_015155 [Parelaphostrongylus tenuis]|uniref:Zinc finger C2H2 LYAR-type domain-containing protein n=1 Tax=Parelaphostrongylus tenuis TaxID=148309 RepID=A0AAD5MEH0_PARTN|nr:hypothetical protein KIN20_015155 [Parelaphostrongylus tenuis]